jgi:hypothetical protein
MSETLQLRLQQEEIPAHPKHSPEPIAVQLVTGVELVDGTSFQGAGYSQYLPETTLSLEWPTDMAERVAEHYEKYLARFAQPDSDWNCHSFVADAMDWEVQWSSEGYPYYMPRKLRSVDPTQLQDQEPYAVSPIFKDIEHSMIGLPDPTQNLGVWGMRKNLRVAPNEATAKYYGGKIYPHKVPRRLGGIATRLLQSHDRIPLSVQHRV